MHLLSYIVKIIFDDKTINIKGAQREAFLDRCIEEFKVSTCVFLILSV